MLSRILIAYCLVSLMTGIAGQASSPSIEIGVELHVSHAVERVDGTIMWQAAAAVFGWVPAGPSWTLRTSLGTSLSSWTPHFTLGAVRRVTDRFAADLELSAHRLPGDRRWITLALGGRFIAYDRHAAAVPEIILSSFPVSLGAANLGGNAGKWSFQVTPGANLTVDCSWFAGEHVRFGEAIMAAIIAPLPETTDASLPVGKTAGGVLTLTSHAGYIP